MDARNVRIYENHMSHGHDALFFIPVRILVAMKSKTFNMDHKFNCHSLPTSWRLSITYEQKPETGAVSCSLILSRIDAGSGNLMVLVTISYVDDVERFIRYPRLICSGQVPAGGQIQGSVEEARHPGYRSYLFNLGLFLKFSLYVRNCHGMKVDADSCSSSDAKEALHSKI